MKPSGLATISVFPLGVRNMGTFPYVVVQRRDTQCDSLIGHILASPGIRELCKVRAERGMQRRICGFRATGETTMDFRPREALFFGDNFLKLVTIGFKFSHHPFQPKRRYPSIWSLNKISEFRVPVIDP